MNERIQELAEQAGWMMGDEVDGFNTRLEKFTELILSDIENIVDALYHAMPLEQAAVLLTLDENIKEHFYGVEA